MPHSYKHFFSILKCFLFNIHTPVDASQNKQGFSILSKDTLTGTEPPTFQLVDDPDLHDLHDKACKRWMCLMHGEELTCTRAPGYNTSASNPRKKHLQRQ